MNAPHDAVTRTESVEVPRPIRLSPKLKLRLADVLGVRLQPTTC